jgi:hypothetical protein
MDRVAFRCCAVFITGQIFEVLLGELFAPAYLPYYPRATIKDPPFVYIRLETLYFIDLRLEIMAQTQSKLVENAIQSAKIVRSFHLDCCQVFQRSGTHF